MQVGDLLHAEPAELSLADAASHVVAGPIIHLDDEYVATGANLEKS